MGGGRVQGGEKKFPWKHFPVYLTIVPPAKTSQISPLITSKPVRVPCCDSTASQMFQRMQHWAADIYFQFHMDFHHGVLGSCAWGCQAQLSVGCSKGSAEDKKYESPESWWQAHSVAREQSHHGKKFNNTPSYFPSPLTHVQVHLSSGYVMHSVPTSEKCTKSCYFFTQKELAATSEILEQETYFQKSINIHNYERIVSHCQWKVIQFSRVKHQISH